MIVIIEHRDSGQVTRVAAQMAKDRACDGKEENCQASENSPDDGPDWY